MLAVFAVLQKDAFFKHFRANFHTQRDTLSSLILWGLGMKK